MCGEYRDLHLLKDRLKASPQNPTRPALIFQRPTGLMTRSRGLAGWRIKRIPWAGMASPGPPCPHALPLSLGPFNNYPAVTGIGDKGQDKNLPFPDGQAPTSHHCIYCKHSFTLEGYIPRLPVNSWNHRHHQILRAWSFPTHTHRKGLSGVIST